MTSTPSDQPAGTAARHQVLDATVSGSARGDLAGTAGLTAGQVPETVRIPNYEPWGGAYCFGNLEMDGWALDLYRWADLALESDIAVYVLAPTNLRDNPLEVYGIRRYTPGEDIDPFTVAGMLVLTDAGLRVAADVWDIYANGGFSSEAGWTPAARRP